MATPDDDAPIILSPETYARHEAAAQYVGQMVRTRAPRPGRSRFPGLAPGAWGLLAAGDTISACSGITLGGGSVKLCDRDGAAYSPDETVDVANAGGAITADGGDTIVALEWVLGEWVACGCGDCLGCLPCCIPRKDLTISWAYPSPPVGVPASGSLTMAYDVGVDQWATACQAKTAGFPLGSWVWSLRCDIIFVTKKTQFIETHWGNPTCSGPGTGSVVSDSPVDWTCSPFHLHFKDNTVFPTGDVYIDA